MSDIPATLEFVDPTETDSRWRVVLWAAPGEGKSVGAASAPAPNVVLSADRPGAYRFARRHFPDKDIREVRYEGPATLAALIAYLREAGDVATVTIDPFHNIYESLSQAAPKAREGGPDYQWVNRQITRFLYSLREFDVNVVLVAHERLNDGKKGDGKLYPQLGGPALINKVLAESDVVARVERVQQTEGKAEWWAQLAPTDLLVCKESTGVLGDRRVLDLSEWFEAAAPDNSDLPFDPDAPVDDEAPDEDGNNPDSPGGQFDLDEAKAA